MYKQLEDPDPCPHRGHNWYLKATGFLLGLAAALTIFTLVYYSVLLKSERENSVLLKFEKMLENQNNTNIYVGF